MAATPSKGCDETSVVPVKASVWATSVNMFVSLADVMVSVPWCLKAMSPATGVVVLALVALATELGFEAVVWSCEGCEVASYVALAERTFGAGWWFEAFRCAYLLGTGVVWMVIMGDTLLGDGREGLLTGLLGVSAAGEEESPLATRVVVMVTFATVILVPCCLPRTLDASKYAGGVAVVGLAYVVGVLFFEAWQKRDDFEVSMRDVRVTPASWRTSEPTVVFTTLNYAFVVTHNLPRYYYELDRRSPTRLRKAAVPALCAGVVVDAAVGIAGYLAYGAKTKSNVLLDLPTTPVGVAARVAVLVVVVPNYAKILHATRVALLNVLLPFASSSSSFFFFFFFKKEA